MKHLFLLLALVPSFAFASLEKEIQDIGMDEQVPQSDSKVNYHAVQDRNPVLKNHVAIVGGAGTFVSGNGFLTSRTMGVSGTFYFTDKIGASLGYSSVSNKFNASADGLVKQAGVMPDVDFAKSRVEAAAVYNLLYGKFRVSRDTAFIFDQYLELGLASTSMRSGSAMGPVAGAGVAFWMNKWTVRVGVKDYYHHEKSLYTEGNYHNVALGIAAGTLL